LERKAEHTIGITPLNWNGVVFVECETANGLFARFTNDRLA
jgi:hypothetical protein